VQRPFHAYRLQATGISQPFSRGIEMKVLTWNAVLTILNPSPIFVAVASFAEMLAMMDFDPTQLNQHEEKASHKSQR
jgi:hypothetical protein